MSNTYLIVNLFCLELDLSSLRIVKDGICKRHSYIYVYPNLDQELNKAHAHTYHLASASVYWNSFQSQSSHVSMYLTVLVPSFHPPVLIKIPSAVRPPDEHHGSNTICTKLSKAHQTIIKKIKDQDYKQN